MVLFPVTYSTDKKLVAEFLTLSVAFEPSPDNDYVGVTLGEDQCGNVVTLYFSREIETEINIVMSIQSAIVAANRTWPTTMDVYVTIWNEIPVRSISGSSIGLAVYVGYMACCFDVNVPEQYAFTGMVSVGLRHAIPITVAIDNVVTKAKKARTTKRTLFIPETNARGMPEDYWDEERFVDECSRSCTVPELPSVVGITHPECLSLLFRHAVEINDD